MRDYGVGTLRTLQEVEAENVRLREVQRAARVYFREFDHLIGDDDHPERRALRLALTPEKAAEKCDCPSPRSLQEGHVHVAD